MSDYAGPILGVVGAVIGFYVGGPTGAYYGWAIGSTLGGMYSASQQVLPGPKIGDVQKQTSQEGGFRPIVFGRSVPMSGNIIADSEPVKVYREVEQGKGGPAVETEYVYRTYAVGFGEGECELLQAWRNGILVADFEDPSMSAENAKFLEYARWYTGAFDQMADPDLEGVYGVGNAPFLRGTMYLVLASEDVTDGRGMWSQWQVRVFRGAVSGGELFSEQFEGDLSSYTAFVPPGAPAGGSLADFSLVSDTYGQALLVGTGPSDTHTAIKRPLEDPAPLQECHFKVQLVTSGDGDCGSVHFRDADLNNVFAFGIRRQASFDSERRPHLWFSDEPGSPENPIGPSGGVTIGDWYQVDVTYDEGSGIFELVMTNLSTMAEHGTLSINVTGRSNIAYVAFENDNVSATGSAGTCLFDDVQILTGIVLDDWYLPEVIENVCGLANLDAGLIDLSLIDPAKVVRGYTIGNSYMAAGILQTLSGVFFFDPANKNGKVAFVPRGRDAAATVLQDDMIDNGEDIEERQESSESRKDGISIPRVLHLNYYDVAGGLNTDKQRSERPEGTRAEFEQSLQTPVVLSADEAATVVAITHGLMAEQQKGELNFALPDNWIRLIESDAVFVETDTKMVRAILARVQTDEGEQRYKAIRDRQSLYTKSVQGIPAAPVTRPPSSVAGATIIEFIDVPVLRDSHDMLGFRMGVSGVLPAWPGALVEMSTDSGATYLEAQSTRVSSVMGELVTALADHPPEFPDEVNTCQVQINTPNVTLENTDLTGMLNRRNQAIIGDEIVNFATVDEVSEGVWELSYFLRGRKHTDAEAHITGERFVLLGTTLFIPAELAWLNRTLTFRATTFGRPVSEATIISATFTGQSQTEFPPAYLQARRDGTDVVASWQGVGRLGGGANVAMGAYFQGYRVTLTDGSVTQTFDQVAESITTSLSAFTGPVTVRVQQRNQLTGLGPYIEVII